MAIWQGMRRGAALMAGLSLGLAAAWPAQAQLRPLARPADLAAAVAAAVPVSAAPGETLGAVALGAEAALEAAAPLLGPETSLPLPRFVSLKTGEGNARRGPSLEHRIDWVFVREDMPLRITAEYGHWRRVEDRDGLGGWVHYALLSGSRTVIVDQELLPLRVRADDRAAEVARVEAGVVARLESCTPDWCRVSAGGYRGWAPKPALWGVGADEVLD